MESAPVSDHDTVEVVDGVYLTQLTAGAETSIQHFRVEPGATVPEHSHHHEQTGFVFAGTLSFEVAGETVAVGPGESFTLPGDEPHAVANDGDEPAEGIDVFAPPRPDPDWTD